MYMMCQVLEEESNDFVSRCNSEELYDRAAMSAGWISNTRGSSRVSLIQTTAASAF